VDEAAEQVAAGYPKSLRRRVCTDGWANARVGRLEVEGAVGVGCRNTISLQTSRSRAVAADAVASLRERERHADGQRDLTINLSVFRRDPSRPP
jgi:hypothetical protein